MPAKAQKLRTYREELPMMQRQRLNPMMPFLPRYGQSRSAGARSARSRARGTR